MSKEKRQQRIREHAEWCWEQAQIRAASAMTALDAAVEVYERDKPEDFPKEEADKIEAQIQEQRKRIEEYVMSEKDIYLERIGVLHA